MCDAKWCVVPGFSLQVAAQEPASILSLLQQLTHPSIPNFCIINCEAWQPLLLLLPQLLTCSSTDTAAAAHKLLLQQLAPELLDCNPEPLAQLLVALLAAASSSQLATAEAAESAADGGTIVTPAVVADVDAGSVCTWSSSVVQLLVVGLSKLSRQWHFLDTELALQLCSALVDVLLQPFMHLLRPQQQQQQQGQQTLVAMLPPQQQQQQGQQPQLQQQHVACCLAEQLLLTDPGMGWWHRLNANAKSCRGLRRAAADKGLVQVLLQHVQQVSQHSSRQQQQLPSNADEQVMATQAAAAAGVAAQHTQQTTTSSSTSSVTLADCLVVQLLSGFVANPAGRQVLHAAAVAAAQQSSCIGQHYVSRAQPTVWQQQQPTPARTGGALEPPVGWDVFAEVVSCLQSMAGACTAASACCGDPVAAAAAAAAAEARRALAAMNDSAGV
jgi:hypothetical protein